MRGRTFSGECMRRIWLTNLLLASVFAAPAAHASVVLLASGTLTGSSAGANADLSGLTGTLENGVAANFLGGLGSGIAYAGGNTFVAVPDRGPNAVPFNSNIDDTVSYINRFQTLSMTLTPNAPGSALPYSLTPTLTGTTLLYSPTPLNYGTGAGMGTTITGAPLPNGAPAQNTTGKYYFTGRSDNFGSGNSGNPADARFDPESVRVSPDGKSVFISDEYGPYVRQFDRSTGALIKTYTLPGNLDVTKLSAQGNTEIADNSVGRIANKGMEGLALTPDGKTLVGIMQAPLEQDAGNPATANMLRIVTVDVATGVTHEYGYNLTSGSGVSDIVAINDHEFLVDERDGKGLGDGSKAKVKQGFVIDLSNATDITGLTGTAAEADVVGKTEFIDVAKLLETEDGLSASQVPSKIEGYAFGQDIEVNGTLEHTLYVANDNDFLPAESGENEFYVFGFSDSDLPGFEQEQFVSAVPLPASLPLFSAGLGALGLFGWRRRKARASL